MPAADSPGSLSARVSQDRVNNGRITKNGKLSAMPAGSPGRLDAGRGMSLSVGPPDAASIYPRTAGRKVPDLSERGSQSCQVPNPLPGQTVSSAAPISKNGMAGRAGHRGLRAGHLAVVFPCGEKLRRGSKCLPLLLYDALLQLWPLPLLLCLFACAASGALLPPLDRR